MSFLAQRVACITRNAISCGLSMDVGVWWTLVATSVDHIFIFIILVQ